MKKTDFAIGTEFYTATGRWRCTDVGSRIVAAIKLDQDDERWYNGPPYKVAESVFDEYAMEGCSLDPDAYRYSGMGFAVVSLDVEHGAPVFRIFRELPAYVPDSGWRLLGSSETHEFLNDIRNVRYADLTALARSDECVRRVLDEGRPRTMYARSSIGTPFVETSSVATPALPVDQLRIRWESSRERGRPSGSRTPPS